MLTYIKKLKPGSAKPSSPTTETLPPALTISSTTANAHVVDDEKSPILSPADEKFLENALKDAHDSPNVIFPGLESTSTTGTVTPAVEEAVIEAEKEAKKDGEWKDVLTTRWQGLRKTVTEVAEKRHHRKSKSPDKDKDKGKGKEKEEEEILEEDSEAVTPVETKAEKKEKEKEKKKDKGKKKKKAKEFVREEDELTAALDQLNLAAEDGRAFSVSAETRALLASFTQILKDIANGVPTAYDDLTKLLETSSSQLEKTFTNLPGFLQKFVKTLPEKIKPEIMQAAAAASPALVTEGGIIGLQELVTKPGLLMGLLKGVVNVLKTRFPALLGANAALSMGLFVVLLVLWYCYKRGREVRLEKEAKEAEAAATLAEAEKEADVEAEKKTEVAAESSTTEGDLQEAEAAVMLPEAEKEAEVAAEKKTEVAAESSAIEGDLQDGVKL